MERDRAREYIDQQEPSFLRPAKKGYICPSCNNGAGSTGDGITLDPRDRQHYKCFRCGLYADVIELYGLEQGIEDFNSQLIEAGRYYGVEIDRPAHSSAREDFSQEVQNYPKTERYTQKDTHTAVYTQEPDYTDFYREAHSHLAETDYRRGLSQETLDRFNIGYVENWRHPKAPTAPTSPRLIIPTSRSSYLARDTRSQLTEEQSKYSKSKVGAVHIFNGEALQNASKPVFVVEGEIDALSIIDAGGEALALGSTANVKKLLDQLRDTAPAQPLIVSLDNDGAGKKAQQSLTEGLKQLSIEFYEYNPAGDYKDANESLQGDREAFIARVARADNIKRELIEAERAEYMLNSTASHLQEFVDGIKDSVNTPYIPTGFSKLDDTLDGGLYEGLYILGAISSLGKTTFTTQIADQIAQSEQDVLIFSLEMARAEIMSKSISRHTLQNILATGGDIRNAKTARGITTGRRYQNYSRAELELINSAIKEYASYAEQIFITEGVGNIGVEQVASTVLKHIAITGNHPVVIIDYLQILAPYNERYTDKQNVDKAVMELKRLSRDCKIPVIAISSLNRQNYKEAISMEAFKESGAVEYSSDVLIGLQLAGAGTKDFNPTAEKQKNPRAVELVILKNRNGSTGDKLKYDYYPLFNYFKEC